ncbi:MAG: hypothetical protein AAF560_31785 [Acidobacteriota bacterium]
MKQHPVSAWLSTAALALALVVCPATASAAELSAQPTEVTFDLQQSFESVRLTVGSPDGKVSRHDFTSADIVSFGLVDDEGGSRPDGLYSYELHGRTAASEKTPEGFQVLLRSGFFSIADGAFLSPELPEASSLNKQLIADDLFVQGSACIGTDCVNDSFFAFMTLKLSENNTRLMFDDTSDNAGFAANDWALVANDNFNGGANRFSIQDCGAGSNNCGSGTVPFSVVAGAPDNAVFVGANGNLGLGTAVPDTDLQILNGNTPAIRLEQDGSAGFVAYSWDVAGNETNFFVRDFNTGDLPFRILAGAPEDALVIDAAGNLGVGTDNPGAKLDVRGDVAVTGLVDGRDVAADGAALDAHVADFNNPHQVTAAQVGAVSATELASHVSDFNNPHQVTAAQVGAVSAAELASHVGDFNNPHQVTAAQVGAATAADLTSHVGDFNNPHQVTAAQVGAPTVAELAGHVGDFNNPHQVTAAQVGADPAGTGATAAAAAITAHEAAFNHANIPSALPVPVAQGGTGATDAAAARAALGITDDPTKVGIVAQSEFSTGGNATATVTFATPFAAGTSYAVSLTAYSDRVGRTFAPTLLAKDENGFTIGLGARANRLVEVNWMARPVTE